MKTSWSFQMKSLSQELYSKPLISISLLVPSSSSGSENPNTQRGGLRCAFGVDRSIVPIIICIYHIRIHHIIDAIAIIVIMTEIQDKDPSALFCLTTSFISSSDAPSNLAESMAINSFV